MVLCTVVNQDGPVTAVSASRTSNGSNHYGVQSLVTLGSPRFLTWACTGNGHRSYLAVPCRLAQANLETSLLQYLNQELLRSEKGSGGLGDGLSCGESSKYSVTALNCVDTDTF